MVSGTCFHGKCAFLWVEHKLARGHARMHGLARFLHLFGTCSRHVGHFDHLFRAFLATVVDGADSEQARRIVIRVNVGKTCVDVRSRLCPKNVRLLPRTKSTKMIFFALAVDMLIILAPPHPPKYHDHQWIGSQFNRHNAGTVSAAPQQPKCHKHQRMDRHLFAVCRKRSHAVVQLPLPEFLNHIGSAQTEVFGRPAAAALASEICSTHKLPSLEYRPSLTSRHGWPENGAR